MNEYGHTAMRFWQQMLAERYAAIPDPQTHFRELGAEIETEVIDLADQLWDQALEEAGRPTDGNLRAGLLRTARLRAAELVMYDRVYSQLPPETDT